MPENFIPLQEIFIPETRQRRLFKLEEIQELSESIARIGLLHPVILRETGQGYQLVAGERRLRAIQDLYAFDQHFYFCGGLVPKGMVPFLSLGQLTPVEAMEAELEENIRRSDLTWQEKAAATSALMALREAQADASGASPPTVADIAKEIHGASNGYYGDSVKKELILSKHLSNPSIQGAKTADEAFKILRREEERNKNEAFGKSIGSSYKKSDFVLRNTNSKTYMEGCPPETFDVILTDPPYGMGADKFNDSGKAGLTHTYEDSMDALVDILSWAPPEFYRLAKPEAHAYIFCSLEGFFLWKDYMTKAGWKVFSTPLIWHKPDGFRTPWVNAGPQRQYETILFASKGSKPVQQVKSDVITCPRGSYPGYAAAKPSALLRDLLLRSTTPGDKVLDPFCGSGSIFPAAYEAKCFATGIEIDPAAYALAAKRIEEIL